VPARLNKNLLRRYPMTASGTFRKQGSDEQLPLRGLGFDDAGLTVGVASGGTRILCRRLQFADEPANISGLHWI
jgi:hypothetical protein